jgi:tRNA A37 methylthiotransferase MiaB
MARKLFIRTFGCQMNEYDSDKMADVLAASEEIVRTDTPDDADIILFNTCSVREKAQERVFHDLGRVRPLKLANPNLMIGVGGCVASQEGAAIVARAPFVDVVFGPQTLHRLPQLFADRRDSASRRSTSPSPKSRSSTICRRPGSRACRLSSRSWRAAASSVRSASFPTPAAKRSRARSTTSSPKSRDSPRKACRKSPCSVRT